MADEFRQVSPEIDNEGRLPRKQTGEGQGAKKNLSPPVEWFTVPEGAKSLALVVQGLNISDPDGPNVPWPHCMALQGWVHPQIPQLAITGFSETASNLYASERRCSCRHIQDSEHKTVANAVI